MAKAKGSAKSGGRAAGTPNKATVEFRQTVTALLENNAQNVSIWLDRVAEGHGETKPAPDKALELLARLAEFAAPKLARTEITGSNGGPVVIAASKLDEQL
jgi:hypothetical protein